MDVHRSPNGCAQNDRMPMGWYISLHTIGIRSHLLAYGRFDFSMYVGDTLPQIILYSSKCTQIFMHSPSLRRCRPLKSLLYVVFIPLYTYTYIITYSAGRKRPSITFLQKNNNIHNGLYVLFSAKTARFDVVTSRTHRVYIDAIVCVFSACKTGWIKPFSSFFIHKNTPINTATTIIIMSTSECVRNSRKYNGTPSLTMCRRPSYDFSSQKRHFINDFTAKTNSTKRKKNNFPPFAISFAAIT